MARDKLPDRRLSVTDKIMVMLDNGKKVKACADTKKLAVVPLADIPNVSFNGPMLLRVTSSELGDLGTFADQMKARGFPYNSVAVRLGFDHDASHPKVTFKAIRPLTSDEATEVLELYRSDSVARVLSADFTAEVVAETGQAPAPAPQADPDFEIPPQAAAPAAKPRAAAPAPATPAPVPTATSSSPVSTLLARSTRSSASSFLSSPSSSSSSGS